MSKAATARKKTPPARAVSTAKRAQFRLGGKDVSVGGGDGGNRLKLENKKGSNMFVILSPGYELILEHFIPQPGDSKRKKGDEKKDNFYYSLCGVHDTGDESLMESAIYKGAADHCEMCAGVRSLFEEAADMKDAKPDAAKVLQDIAGRVKCNGTVLFLAAACEVDTSRVNGKKVIKPYIELAALQEPKVLTLTWAAFKKFREAWDVAGIDSIVGLPINWERGSDGAQKISKVQRVDFFPAYRVNKGLPKVPEQPDFSQYMKFTPYAEKAAVKAWDAFQSEVLPSMIAQSKARKGKGR